MTDEKFILLNLEDKKSKDIAQVISSDTARKILNLLSEKSYAETDISKKINIPLSTVHYNLQALLKSNIIEIEDFLWSEKGKKINVYKLANKLIIISPKKYDETLNEKLKSIMPAFLISLLGAIGIFVYKNFYSNVLENKTMAGVTMEKSAVAIPYLNDTPAYDFNIAFWFLLGSITVIIFYIVITLLRKRK